MDGGGGGGAFNSSNFSGRKHRIWHVASVLPIAHLFTENFINDAKRRGRSFFWLLATLVLTGTETMAAVGEAFHKKKRSEDKGVGNCVKGFFAAWVIN